MNDMKVLIFPNENEHVLLKNYLNARDISFQYYDKWDFSSGNNFVIPDEECLLILPYSILGNINLTTFLKDVNASKCHIYFIQHLDNVLLFEKYEEVIVQITRPVYLHIDAALHQNSLRVVTTRFEFTGVLNDNFYLNTNHDRTKDFLLTTVVKPARLHRKILVDKLKQANLLTNYAGKIHDHDSYLNHGYKKKLMQDQQAWKGTVTSAGEHEWVDGKVHWDLYNSVYYELVPETLHSYGSFFTEKIWKPIVAKIPFICLSDYKFYDTLHSLGFKTFEGIIDESFASEPDLEKRVDKIIHTMSNINPKEFYEKSQDICEHNYKTLCHFHYENTNRFVRQLDNFFKTNI